MRGLELEIKGSWQIELDPFVDDRGTFFESFKLNSLEKITKRKFDVKQANTSISKMGSIRGIHFALLPPSQAKYIQCVSGSILDFIIDVRLGSPTFAKHIAVELTGDSNKSIFIEEGLAHAFIALEDNTKVTYLVNQYFNPNNEKSISPFDEDISIEWGALDYILSEKDKNSDSLKEMERANRLPSYKDCAKYIDSLKV